MRRLFTFGNLVPAVTIVEDLQPWLMEGPNLMALELRTFRTDDTLLILDLDESTLTN